MIKVNTELYTDNTGWFGHSYEGLSSDQISSWAGHELENDEEALNLVFEGSSGAIVLYHEESFGDRQWHIGTVRSAKQEDVENDVKELITQLERYRLSLPFVEGLSMRELKETKLHAETMGLDMLDRYKSHFTNFNYACVERLIKDVDEELIKRAS